MNAESQQVLGIGTAAPKISGSDEYGTPPLIYEVSAEICECKFELDAAANKENALCPDFYDIHSNGLEQPWAPFTWCNPPYSNPLPWVVKALFEVFYAKNTQLAALLLKLDPATEWYERGRVAGDASITFRRRIRFIGAKDVANFPSVLMVFAREKHSVHDIAPDYYYDQRDRKFIGPEYHRRVAA